MLKKVFLHLYQAAGRTGSGRPYLNCTRSISAWINSAKAGASSSGFKDLDVEKLFTEDDVQKLLSELTGVELDRIFAERVFDGHERSHFALMTDKMYEESLEKMKNEGRNFLQFVPVKEPRSNTVEILSEEPLLEAFDQSKMVFVDITFDATNRDRTIVVREPSGTLRTAYPEERDRMNRTFFAQPNRPISEPPIFSDPYLKEALARNDHEYVMDYAAYFYEPDSPAFVKLCLEIFDRIIAEKKFSTLYSTRHFGPFVFYMVLNGNIRPLLNYFASTGSYSNAAKLIRLYKRIHPDWRIAIGTDDDDKKIVLDYIKQNRPYESELVDLIKLMFGDLKQPTPSSSKAEKPPEQLKMRIMDKEKLRGREGPLGDMASEYNVRLATSSYEKEEEGNKQPEKRKMSAQGRRIFKPRIIKKPEKKS